MSGGSLAERLEPAEVAVEAVVDGSPPRVFGGERVPAMAELLAAPLKSRPRPSRGQAELRTLAGIGPRMAELAADGLELRTVGDMTWHLPHAYRDRTRRLRIGELEDGVEATVRAEVKSIRVRPTRRRNLRIVEATVFDETGSMQAVWFNQFWLAKQLEAGTKLLLNGRFENGSFKIAAHELADGGEAEEGIHTDGLVPVHPANDRLKPGRLREWAVSSLAATGDAGDPLPAATRTVHGFGLHRDAIVEVHFPRSRELADRARERLAIEELMLHQLALAGSRRRHRMSRHAAAFRPPGDLVETWLASLPFEPTDDQRAACAQIDADIAVGGAMQRLLMGEVGSGKTMVALYAMLRAVESGFQATLMAPTETLAEQHAMTLERLLEPLGEGAGFALLTGSTTAKQRGEILSGLADGEIGIVVGTHALLEPDVQFESLALAVVDEQHRFGVRQRALLDKKGPAGLHPHALHMTATPIPRTLSLTAYGDLDCTTLKQLPLGRRPVQTEIVATDDARAAAYEFVRGELRAGRQAFVVCPLVEQSEKLEARVATEEAQRLAAGEFADFNVGLIHGQMKSAEKAAAMQSFANGETDVLVATTVIEVGIDVANATVMIVEDAQRYGLSQLHQLRGRVGRGGHDSRCLLFADPQSRSARTRLQALAAGHDGFHLAEIDLRLRGEGEILGTRQHGVARFRAAILPDDAALLELARQELIRIGKGESALSPEELAPLKAAAEARFGGGGIAA